MRGATASTIVMGIPIGVILLGAVVYPSLVLIWTALNRGGEPTWQIPHSDSNGQEPRQDENQ